MNRLMIIGNGFDLAHGYKTGITDFFEDLLKQIVDIGVDDEGNENVKISGQKSEKDPSLYYLRDKKSESGIDPWICAELDEHRVRPELAVNLDRTSWYFKSLFEQYREQHTWAKVEAHYFDLIKTHYKVEDKIATINEEFRHLEILMEKYLKRVEKNVRVSDYTHPSTLPLQNLFKAEHRGIDFERTYVVSFNYTSRLLVKYIELFREFGGNSSSWEGPIFIHGRLEDKENPIIFGYGDTETPEYKDLENIDNRNLLQIIKPIKYRRTAYDNELRQKIQKGGMLYVQILGHSCGMTDRTLLKSVLNWDGVQRIEYHYHSDDAWDENMESISKLFDDRERYSRLLARFNETRQFPVVKKNK